MLHQSNVMQKHKERKMGSFIPHSIRKSTLLLLIAAATVGVSSVSASIKNKTNRTTAPNIAAFKSRLSELQAQQQKKRRQILSSASRIQALQSAHKAHVTSFRYVYLPYSIGAITVNTTTDEAAVNAAVSDTAADGMVSLRSAVQYANKIIGSDTIIVPAGTYTLTIAPLGGDTAATGNLDINDSLTIKGAGENETIIDGNQIDRIFNIGSINTSIAVKLSGLMITGGYSSGSNPDDAGFGGGMEVNGGTVGLDSVNVINNYSDYSGGGIGIYDGTFTMNYGSLSNNFADAGGTHDLTDDGGGADIWSGTSTFNGVTIDSNVAVIGGGIDNFFGGTGANLVLSECIFIDDSTVAGQFFYGGGLENYQGNFTIDSCTFRNCYGDGDGGAIDISAGANTITNSIFDGNYSPFIAGAIQDAGTSLTMTGDSVVWNTARFGFGGILTISQFKMQDSFIGYNSTTSDMTGHIAGGIALGSIDTLINVSIRGNSADLGAGVTSDTAYVYFSQVDIDSNTATLYGGGVFAVNDFNMYFSQVHIDGNSAGESGGGILDSNITVHFSQVYVDSNHSFVGGGIDDESGGIVWESGSMSDNTADSVGGGMYFNGIANDTLYHVTTTGNSPDPIYNAMSGAYAVVLIDASLPVQATDFVATSGIGSVTLSWNTQSEVANAGFNILREDPNASSFKLISSYTSNDSLKGIGTSSTGRSYGFTDNHVVSGSTYQYEIQSVSTNGATKDLTTISITVGVPKSYALYQNYPNPFNPTTVISYQLSAISRVTLKVYDVLGREVATLVDGQQNPGAYKVSFDGTKYASGVYFYRISAAGNDGQKFVSIKKLVLMK